jgi:anti-sigma28 factor (negative regulator of flagellin synthesis)
MSMLSTIRGARNVPWIARLPQAAQVRIREIEATTTEADRLVVLSAYLRAVHNAHGDDALLNEARLAKRQGFADVYATQQEHAKLYGFPEDGVWTNVVVKHDKKRNQNFYDHPRQGRWTSVELALAAVVSGAISPRAMPNGIINSNKRGPKKRKATKSTKKGKASTTSAKKRKAKAKTVSSEDEDSASYSPSDSSDSEVEETSAPVLARAARSGRAALKKGAYVESNGDSDAESDGDSD